MTLYDIIKDIKDNIRDDNPGYDIEDSVEIWLEDNAYRDPRHNTYEAEEMVEAWLEDYRRGDIDLYEWGLESEAD